eukprot:c22634_g1_i1 orf=176-1930(-)
MVDSVASEFCSSPGFLLEASEEEWIKKARELTACLLSKAALVQAFRGRWIAICTRLQRLSETLESICNFASLQQSFLHHRSTLPQIVSSLVEGKELAQKSIDLSYGGKLLMQSNLDALVTKLDHHLRELDAVKGSMRQQERALAITLAMTSSTENPKHDSPATHRKEQVWDMFAKLKAGNTEMKKGALEALIQFMREDDKAALLVADEGDLHRLIHLLDSSLPIIRERAAHAISLMAMVDGCRKNLLAEGALHLLIRVLESGNSHAKEKAARALFELTCVAENAHAVVAQGAIPLLVKLCNQRNLAAATCAAGTLCNLAQNEHIRRTLAENGAIEALIGLLTSSCSQTKDHAAKSLQNLASGKDDRIRTLIARHGGIHSLLTFLKHAASAEAQETAIQALRKLATSTTNVKALVSAGYVAQLAELLNTGPSRVQQLAALAICNLSNYMDLKKQACIRPLTKMLDSKDVSEQRVAAQAISTLFLGNNNRRKEFCKEGKSMLGLVRLLNPCRQRITKRLSMSALLVLSASPSPSYKNRIMSTDAQTHCENLVETNVTGAKKILHKSGGKKLLGIFSKHKSSSSSSS